MAFSKEQQRAIQDAAITEFGIARLNGASAGLAECRAITARKDEQARMNGVSREARIDQIMKECGVDPVEAAMLYELERD